MKNNIDNDGEGIKMSLSQIKEFLKEYEFLRVKNEFMERIISMVFISFGLITALAWDDTIKDIFHLIFNGVETLSEKIVYSLSVTLIAVIASISLSRFVKRKTVKN